MSLSILLLTPIMTVPLKNYIFYFYGRDANNEKRQEDLAEFMKNLNFAIDGQIYMDKNLKLIAIQVIF